METSEARSPRYFNAAEEIDRALGLLLPLREKAPA